MCVLRDSIRTGQNTLRIAEGKKRALSVASKGKVQRNKVTN